MIDTQFQNHFLLGFIFIRYKRIQIVFKPTDV